VRQYFLNSNHYLKEISSCEAHPFYKARTKSALASDYLSLAYYWALPSTLIFHAEEGQRAWQWLSSHWVHINKQHLIWNMAALLILASLIEQTSRLLVLAALALGILGVNIYLAFFYSLDAYAGLSGALNSLLVIALYCLYQRPEYRAAAVITLILSVAKIIVEMLIQASLFSNLPWPPVPQAHLAGMLGGFLLILVLEIRKRRLLNSCLVNFGP